MACRCKTYDPSYHPTLAGRLGLHTGQVAVEATGPTPALTAMLMGEVVALATVLQEYAEPGTILSRRAAADVHDSYWTSPSRMDWNLLAQLSFR